jgi:hypothetical protein
LCKTKGLGVDSSGPFFILELPLILTMPLRGEGENSFVHSTLLLLEVTGHQY